MREPIAAVLYGGFYFVMLAAAVVMAVVLTVFIAFPVAEHWLPIIRDYWWGAP